MKLIKSVIEKNFTVEHKGKTYYVGYLNSDGQILGLSNRFHWEVYDEELESVYNNLANALIRFCIKHFNDYQPDYEND